MSIYEQLGLTTIVNAAGTLTRLGGTLVTPEVRDAMSDAAKAMVPIDELQSVASKVIAEACGSEAGYVTSGASAGLTLATAACMVGLDIARMDQLPFLVGGKNEVIICRPHRNSYDHAYRAAGARLVEVGMSDRHTGAGVRETEIWEIEAAIGERTAAIAYTAGAGSFPALKDVSALARKHAVPVIVDAAGQLPPPSNLKHFIAEGADLVSFSGGKAIRGPQGTGILAGRRDLIASVALQQLDMDVTFALWTPPANLIPKEKLAGAPRHGLGRGYKVAKEQIVGLIVALQLFTEERARKDHERWAGLLRTIEQALKPYRKARAIFVPPRHELGFPVLEIQIDERELGLTAYELAARLKAGKPPIHVGEGKVMDGCLLIHPANLDDAAAAVLIERLLAALQEGRSIS
ncbi:MAG: aminotransferase class V-fold PLP-dependent enzyme [Hyphomicrobiales bacterium]